MAEYLEGLERVFANLNREVSKVKGRTVAGLLAGGLIIQAEAQRRTPVDTGNLKGSAYTRKAPDDGKAVEVGFGAAYAIYVHEDLQAFHDDGEAKYLENAAVEKGPEAIAAVAAYAKGESQ